MASLEDRSRGLMLSDPFSFDVSPPSHGSHTLDFILEVSKALLSSGVQTELCERQATTQDDLSFALFGAQILLTSGDFTTFLRSLCCAATGRLGARGDGVQLRTAAEQELSDDGGVGEASYRAYHLPGGLPIYVGLFLGRTLCSLLPLIVRPLLREAAACPLKRLYAFFKNLQKLVVEAPPPALCFVASLAAELSFKNPLFAQSYFYRLFVQHWLVPVLLVNRQISAADAAQAVFFACSLYPVEQTTSIDHRSLRASINATLDKIYKACSSSAAAKFGDRDVPPAAPAADQPAHVPAVLQACFLARYVRALVPDASLPPTFVQVSEEFKHMPTDVDEEASYAVAHAVQMLGMFRCVCLSLELEKAVQHGWS